MSDEFVDYTLKYAPLVESLQSPDMDWLRDYNKTIACHFIDVERRLLKNYSEALNRDFQHLRNAALPAALQNLNLAVRLVSIEDELRKVTRSASHRSLQLLMWQVLRMRLPLPTGAEDLPLLLKRMQGVRTTLADLALS